MGRQRCSCWMVAEKPARWPPTEGIVHDCNGIIGTDGTSQVPLERAEATQKRHKAQDEQLKSQTFSQYMLLLDLSYHTCSSKTPS
ncbi:hypothetical protein DOTSEDRAFT_151572 [Dothistroma septosporum NZE10]|uniref:Uncharacterized protein n=1 Tax=Dothistroma septosporum (strain NZE10 / CBS 128990) TaxID=675120 RepID=N1PKT4_DOTSN|nr:hypothetical protein DOTSEDRAFT_151572 [Dothistroma septosporum NZE10]